MVLIDPGERPWQLVRDWLRLRPDHALRRSTLDT
jgi:hypothetical protein